jgi:hypothetical protein
MSDSFLSVGMSVRFIYRLAFEFFDREDMVVLLDPFFWVYIVLILYLIMGEISALYREHTRASVQANPEIVMPVVPVVPIVAPVVPVVPIVAPVVPVAPIVAPVVTQARRKPRRFCQN